MVLAHRFLCFSGITAEPVIEHQTYLRRSYRALLSNPLVCSSETLQSLPFVPGETTSYLTVQTFDSCTSRPDACKCPVVKTPMHDMSKKNMPCTSMPHVACKSKLRSVVRSSTHRWLGNWVAIERLVVHLVLELNVGTVRGRVADFKYGIYLTRIVTLTYMFSLASQHRASC